MKEYEYSFNVKSLNPYIAYCEDNNYKLIECNDQTRDLYTNGNGILARITINSKGVVLDFKTEDDSSKILKERKESIPLVVNESEIDILYSILDILDYNIIKHLVRTRKVYKKGKIKFEIDEYTSPEPSFVVAIEGEKKEVDKIYKYLKENIEE